MKESIKNIEISLYFLFTFYMSNFTTNLFFMLYYFILMKEYEVTQYFPLTFQNKYIVYKLDTNIQKYLNWTLHVSNLTQFATKRYSFLILQINV